MNARHALGLAAVALVAGGCAAYQERDAFSYRFADNQPEPTRQAVSRLPEPAAPSTEANPLGAPVAVATTEADEREVVAFDIAEGEELWRTPIDALTRPEVLGDVVVLSVRTEEGEAVVALDGRTGQELWRVATEGKAFVGGARDANTVVLVMSVGAAGGARREARVVALDARTGAERWDHEIEGVLGEPAARGGLAFVPWERQNIAILDLASGKEMARLRSTDDVISWVDATPAGVFYGSRGVYRLTERAHTGTKEGSTYRAPPIEDAPGDPLVAEDGFMPDPGTRSARGRIRIFFEPAAAESAEEIPALGERIYFLYYRYVFAFDEEQELAWVRILDQVVAGAQVTGNGLLTMGEQGALHLLDRTTGNDRWTNDVEAELASVTLKARGFDPGGESGEPRDLRASLNEVALDPDNRLVAARAFAVRHLASMEDPEITRDLLDLYAQRSMPSAVRDAIAEALREREVGSEYLVEALDQHYDFIEGTDAPPLKLIVPSLMEQGRAEAVPGLIGQMMDHETPEDVLPLVVRAVVELGDEAVVPPLREFLRLYHADSTFAEDPAALAVAAEGLFRHGGPDGREQIQELAADDTTHDALAGHVRGLFEQEEAEAEARARAEAEAAEEAAREAARQEEAARPLRLSQAQINQTFATHTDALRECIMDEVERNPRLAQVRLVFILENDGRARDLTFAPNTPEFVSCMQPKVQGIEFPKFRSRRQRANFTISLRGGEAEEAAEPAEAEDQPWWIAMRARTPVPEGARQPTGDIPWWVRREPAQPAQAAQADQARPAQPTQPAQSAEPARPAQPERPAQPSGAGQPWWMDEDAAGEGPAQPTEPAQPARPAEPARPAQPAQPEEPENPWWLPQQ